MVCELKLRTRSDNRQKANLLFLLLSNIFVLTVLLLSDIRKWMKKRISVTIDESTYRRLTKFVSSKKPRVSQSSIVDESICEYLKFNQEEPENGSEEKVRSKKEARSKKIKEVN